MRFSVVLSAAAFVLGAFAAPLEFRQETVSNVKCTDPNTTLDFHTSNVALLQICGGIAGTIEKCEGAPTSTVGQSGDVKFTINPVQSGATINISKGRWEQGIKAAFAVCGQNKPFTATFTGGASTGDVNVTYASA
ncbi:hypothetical protein PUNSTDRAFT_139769 [Punctularia strigosozonata HHB-11173 SS5]|uniref:uncharacterized protein n=1 Tax=Punctularia strigosozonata (strain HHB-11173) TaxID=741275 RepID=UPI0004417D48|nr:uncharacterized protein PUNSTDRAFT_139769 [Punctularia strigosozonata HHB-11173 SS5]EIN13107.1 hypothetical protein PUNSTDRAFT_139769 [Punctularia strigosozonata HHB-11173 SS5]